MRIVNKLDICPLYPIIFCNVASTALTVGSLFSCRQNSYVVLCTTHILKLSTFVHGQGRLLFLSSVFYEVAAPACKFSIPPPLFLGALFETPVVDATCLCTFMTGIIDLH